jgi:hypothetical protein
MRIPHKLPSGTGTGFTDGTPGQNPADKIAIIAQRYAGFFVGKFYRFDQQSVFLTTTPDNKGIHLGKAWKEPIVISDDCDFCQHTTDERAVERVAGFQHQIDIEVLRVKSVFYTKWLLENGPDVVEHEWVKSTEPDSGGQVEIGKTASAANRRRFIELHQDVPRQTRTGDDRPDGWKQKALPLVDLPLRLKRKLCIEWNHVYRDYLKDNPSISYDFKARIFLKEMPKLAVLDCCGGVQVWNSDEEISELHTIDCAVEAEHRVTRATLTAASNYPVGTWFGGF